MAVLRRTSSRIRREHCSHSLEFLPNPVFQRTGRRLPNCLACARSVGNVGYQALWRAKKRRSERPKAPKLFSVRVHGWASKLSDVRGVGRRERRNVGRRDDRGVAFMSRNDRRAIGMRRFGGPSMFGERDLAAIRGGERILAVRRAGVA